MKDKKATKKPLKKKDKENPTHKEDFEKVLEMLVPKIKPKGVKGDKMLDE